MKESELYQTVSQKSKVSTKGETEQMNEGFIHDKVKKVLKLIWKTNGDDMVPVDEVPAAVAHLELDVLKKFTSDKDVLSMWDKLSWSSKLSLAKDALGVHA